jgi:hypothetical protein
MRNVRRLTPLEYKGRAGRFIVAIFDAGFQNVIHAIPQHFRMDGANYMIDPERGGASIQMAPPSPPYTMLSTTSSKKQIPSNSTSWLSVVASPSGENRLWHHQRKGKTGSCF